MHRRRVAQVPGSAASSPPSDGCPGAALGARDSRNLDLPLSTENTPLRRRRMESQAKMRSLAENYALPWENGFGTCPQKPALELEQPRRRAGANAIPPYPPPYPRGVSCKRLKTKSHHCQSITIRYILTKNSPVCAVQGPGDCPTATTSRVLLGAQNSSVFRCHAPRFDSTKGKPREAVSRGPRRPLWRGSHLSKPVPDCHGKPKAVLDGRSKSGGDKLRSQPR